MRVRVDSDPARREFVWPQDACPAGMVEEGRKLEFVFLESTSDGSRPASLCRILKDGRILYDASICPVHHARMHRMVVKFANRSPDPAARMLFPFCGTETSCDDPEHGESSVWVCATCRRERERWQEKCRPTATAAR